MSMAGQPGPGASGGSGGKLAVADYVAVGIYFFAVFATSIYSMCRSNRGTVAGYFLAGRYMVWLPVGASIYASNIGSEHFIGLAGSGAAAGIGVGSFELNACILLQVLGWVFLPVYIASGVSTLPEFMKKRFGGHRIQIYLATLSLVLYIFTKISVNLYSGALFIQQALNWNLYVSVILLLIATAFCTVTGGLAAVIYTDTLQTIVMVLGAVTLTVISFVKVEGYSALYYKYMQAVPDVNGTLEILQRAGQTITNTTRTDIAANIALCGQPRNDSWTMLRDPVDSDLPWPGFLLGQTPASIWYWCADQMMVQRVLAAKSLSHAQGGTLFAGLLKLLPFFTMVIPGMISRILWPNEVACSDPVVCQEVCENPAGCSNIAYPKLVLELMPTGLKGVMMAVMLAALMSDLTSIFNSASTLFTLDFYRYIRKSASTRELMIVGRSFAMIMVAVGIVWIPVIQGMQGGQMYIYIQAIAAYLAPPIASVYLVAILWKRANEKGAFWGMMLGMLVGVSRMIMDFWYREPLCGEVDDRPGIITKLHYMYFAAILFFLTGFCMILTSLLTDPPQDKQLIRTTYWTRYDQGTRTDEEMEMVSVDKAGKVALTDEETAERRGMLDGATEGSKRGEIHVSSKSTSARSYLRGGIDWFCGYEDTAQNALSTRKMEERIKRITSLQQDNKARLILNVLLILLVITATFIFIFFSTENFGIFA